MLLHVAPGDELPIYRQIMRQIADLVAGGRLAPGDKLPSQRDLAEQLVISPLTVKKAYDELERQGVIDTIQGRGTFVSSSAPEIDPAERRRRLQGAARRLLTEAHLNDLSLAELQELIEEVHAELGAERSARRRARRSADERKQRKGKP